MKRHAPPPEFPPQKVYRTFYRYRSHVEVATVIEATHELRQVGEGLTMCMGGSMMHGRYGDAAQIYYPVRRCLKCGAPKRTWKSRCWHRCKRCAVPRWQVPSFIHPSGVTLQLPP